MIVLKFAVFCFMVYLVAKSFNLHNEKTIEDLMMKIEVLEKDQQKLKEEYQDRIYILNNTLDMYRGE